MNRRTIAWLAASFVSVWAATSSAATVTGNVTQLEYINTNWGNYSLAQQGQLLIQLDSVNTNYYGQQPSPGSCSSTVYPATNETLKLWQTLASGAMFSGRKLRVEYAECGGSRYILGLAVQK